jgi:hypothetical protein
MTHLQSTFTAEPRPALVVKNAVVAGMVSTLEEVDRHYPDCRGLRFQAFVALVRSLCKGKGGWSVEALERQLRFEAAKEARHV